MYAMIIDEYGEPEVFHKAELEPDIMGPLASLYPTEPPHGMPSIHHDRDDKAHGHQSRRGPRHKMRPALSLNTPNQEPSQKCREATGSIDHAHGGPMNLAGNRLRDGPLDADVQ